MRSTRSPATRLLPDGTPLKNKILLKLPAELYARVVKDLTIVDVVLGAALFETGVVSRQVY
ncbi:MAG: hypothetical protein Q8N52_13415, partial [Acidobacteriota bacterium]|nr:hypothetical protein [Acidobacteriota bacterium]